MTFVSPKRSGPAKLTVSRTSRPTKLPLLTPGNWRTTAAVGTSCHLPAGELLRRADRQDELGSEGDSPERAERFDGEQLDQRVIEAHVGVAGQGHEAPACC